MKSAPLGGVENFGYTLVLGPLESKNKSLHYSLPVIATGPIHWMVVYETVVHNFLKAVCQYRTPGWRMGPICTALPLTYM